MTLNKNDFFFFIGFITEFIRSSVPRCVWRFNSIQKIGFFVLPGRMIPALVYLFCSLHILKGGWWFACYTSQADLQKAPVVPERELDIRMVPEPAAQAEMRFCCEFLNVKSCIEGSKRCHIGNLAWNFLDLQIQKEIKHLSAQLTICME